MRKVVIGFGPASWPVSLLLSLFFQDSNSNPAVTLATNPVNLARILRVMLTIYYSEYKKVSFPLFVWVT
jgi:hypothetical protein